MVACSVFSYQPLLMCHSVCCYSLLLHDTLHLYTEQYGGAPSSAEVDLSEHQGLGNSQ